MTDEEFDEVIAAFHELWPWYGVPDGAPADERQIGPATRRKLWAVLNEYRRLDVLAAIDWYVGERPDDKVPRVEMIRKRLLQTSGERSAAYDTLEPRAQLAWTQRHVFAEMAKAQPDKPWPDFLGLSDDQILELSEQSFRRKARDVYGYIPAHFDVSAWRNVGRTE